jgi:hypothetical protein
MAPEWLPPKVQCQEQHKQQDRSLGLQLSHNNVTSRCHTQADGDHQQQQFAHKQGGLPEAMTAGVVSIQEGELQETKQYMQWMLSKLIIIAKMGCRSIQATIQRRQGLQAIKLIT